MDSGTIGDSNGGLNSRRRFPCPEDRKVYTRRFRKKAQIDDNYDTATASTAQNPSDLASSAATSEGPNDSAAEALVSKDADSSQQNVQGQSHSHRSADKEDDSSTRNRVGQDSGCQNAEQRSSQLERDEVENLKTPSPLHSAKKLPHASFGEYGLNDQPNVREVAGPQVSSGSEPHNEGEFSKVPPMNANGQANVVNGVGKPLVTTRVDDRVRFNFFKETPKNEVEDLRKKLECELHQVRMLAERLEAKKLQIASYNTPVSNSYLGNTRSYVSAEGRNIGGYSNIQSQRVLVEDVVGNRPLFRMNSEVGIVGQHESRPMVLARMNSDMGAARNLEPKPYNRQLSVAVMENSHRDSDYVGKEKRTPKANQYYRNSEFLLGKDRLPPESNKKLKANNGRKRSVETENVFGFGVGLDKSRNQLFKRCSSLLQSLMKHKFGWVFNEPVDAKALGLVDYHDVIKHPMDLGTIKTRLSQSRYKSLMEFAEDVRLVFRNAMTYNPKGQDVHAMAEELSQIFEERWAVIETEYNSYWKYQTYQDLPTPTHRKVPPQSHFALAPVPGSVPGFIPAVVNTNVPASAAPLPMSTHMADDPKIQRPYISRMPAPKKPKARDPNKRDMTYEEKQRLSTNLQGLPAEKLDAIVQIIKRRNTALSQHDDEIEVDIDNVDTETLWELDRFVTNYKKRLSKNKRKAELAQSRKAANHIVMMNTAPAVAEVQIGSAAFQNGTAPHAVDGEKQRYSGSRSSSSSSSSSDSGSSSDTDSDSSSGSDAGHSPKT